MRDHARAHPCQRLKPLKARNPFRIAKKYPTNIAAIYIRNVDKKDLLQNYEQIFNGIEVKWKLFDNAEDLGM